MRIVPDAFLTRRTEVPTRAELTIRRFPPECPECICIGFGCPVVISLSRVGLGHTLLLFEALTRQLL